MHTGGGQTQPFSSDAIVALSSSLLSHGGHTRVRVALRALYALRKEKKIILDAMLDLLNLQDEHEDELDGGTFAMDDVPHTPPELVLH